MAEGPTTSSAPLWAQTAGGGTAFMRGMLVAAGTPGMILFATSLGFGALARDLGFTAGHALFLAASLYALPAQVVLIDQLGRGAALTAAAFAVTLTAVRLLPTTVTLMPYIRDPSRSRWWLLVAVHFIAITAWVEGLRRLPGLPAALRLPHFLGIGGGMITMTLSGTVVGHLLAGSLPPLAAAALLFMTPMYFLLSLTGNATSRADLMAVGLGIALGPLLFLAVPGFDLLVAGLVGGTIAYATGRRRR